MSGSPHQMPVVGPRRAPDLAGCEHTGLVWLQGAGLCSQEGWGGGRSLMLWPLGVGCRSCPRASVDGEGRSVGASPSVLN